MTKGGEFTSGKGAAAPQGLVHELGAEVEQRTITGIHSETESRVLKKQATGGRMENTGGRAKRTPH